MIKEYIGARYIPIFHTATDGSATWEYGVAYEPLEIVLYNNNTYVSKQAVPANTPITNTDYWIKTADFNAQVSYVLDEVNNLREEVDETIRTIGDRKIVYIGDSYSYGERVTADKSGWPEMVSSYLGIPEENYYKLPYLQVVNADGSASTPGFYRTTANHKSFKTMLELLTATLSENQKKEVTDIVVCGGYNDHSATYEAIYAGINDFATYARANYPKAKLHCGFIAWSYVGVTTQRELAYTVKKAYMDSVKLGFNYIANADIVMHNTAFMSVDNIHPNLDGLTAISKNIANCLSGGVSTDLQQNTFTLTSPDGSITLGNTGYSTADISVSNFITFAVRLVFTTPKPRSAFVNDVITTFNHNSNHFRPVDNTPVAVTIGLFTSPSNFNDLELVTAIAQFNEDTITLKVAASVPDHTYYGVALTAMCPTLPRFCC